MLICGKQIVKLFVQAAALLLALGVVCKDEDVSMWSELVLHGLSVVMGLENLVQLVLHMLHKVQAHKRHAIHEISLNGVAGLLIVGWLSLLSPLLCILKLGLILRSISSLSILSVAASISLSLLLVVVSGWLVSVIVGDVIVAIGVLAVEGGVGVEGDLIIVAVESVGEVIVGVDKFIGVSVDLNVDIAVLDAEGIVVAIDRERDGAVANVYPVMIA